MKKLLVTLLFISSLLSVSAQLGFNYYRDSSRVGSPIGNAYTYFKKAYYDHIWNWTKAGADSAEYYLKLAIKEDSNYSAAYAFLAHVYQFKTYDREDWDKKLAFQKQYAEKALSFHPLTGDGYSAMSDVKWHEKDTLQTFSLLRQAIAREPDNVGNYIWIAIRFRQMGTMDGADSSINYMQQILQLDPEYGQAYLKTGNIYHYDKPIHDSAKVYYHKAIDIYNNVKPRDNRMMAAYSFLGQLFQNEQNYDSAVYYYDSFLREMEPSNMYTREVALSSTYKSLFECYNNLSGNYLNKLIRLDKLRIADDSADAGFLLGVLEENYMTVEKDSVLQHFLIPLARKIQNMPATDPYIAVFATLDECEFLRKLKKNSEAKQLLQAMHVKQPKEPWTTFELGREYILEGKNTTGLNLLKETKKMLNDRMPLKLYLDLLNSPDFNQVRNTSEFKELIK